MIRASIFAGLLGLCTVGQARALDAAIFREVAAELTIDDPRKFDERSILAGLLARPDEAAVFEAEARDAWNDPILHPLFIAKWRGRLVPFAATERNRPSPDLSRTYLNWREIMGPEGSAYIDQRLLSMPIDVADKLLYYLDRINRNLVNDDSRIEDGWFYSTRQIVDGIRDEYFKDLDEYLAAPSTQRALADAPAAAAALAEGLARRRAPPPAPPGSANAKTLLKKVLSTANAGLDGWDRRTDLGTVFAGPSSRRRRPLVRLTASTARPAAVIFVSLPHP